MRLEMNVSDSRIADLLVAAFEGGSSYWAGVSGPYASCSKVVTGEASMLVVDHVERKTYRLDMDVVKRGLRVFMRVAPRHFGNWLAENDDAETGDVFLQCCLLDGIVYG